MKGKNRLINNLNSSFQSLSLPENTVSKEQNLITRGLQKIFSNDKDVSTPREPVKTSFKPKMLATSQNPSVLYTHYEEKESEDSIYLKMNQNLNSWKSVRKNIINSNIDQVSASNKKKSSENSVDLSREKRNNLDKINKIVKPKSEIASKNSQLDNYNDQDDHDINQKSFENLLKNQKTSKSNQFSTKKQQITNFELFGSNHYDPSMEESIIYHSHTKLNKPAKSSNSSVLYTANENDDGDQIFQQS